jgi:hypothetical protein
MTRRASLSSVIHVIIFGVTYAGRMVLATAVTPEKTISVTIVTLIQCCRMKMATETETLALGMELSWRMI